MPESRAHGPVGSAWSDVDAAARPERFVTGLDWLRTEPFFVHEKAVLLSGLELRGGERSLDVGCGTGEDTAELVRAGCVATGLDRSSTMLTEARRRHPGVPFVACDANRLPFAAASLDRIRVDRVVQHLPHAAAALREWLRVLASAGRIAILEPDLTTARIDGLDARAAEVVAAWRAGTRPGAAVVCSLEEVLGAAGFEGVRVDVSVLDLTDLGRADGIMGLADWGTAATEAGALDPVAGARWRADVEQAAADGTLRYRCAYVRARARSG